jgi:polyphosphate glucokinase
MAVIKSFGGKTGVGGELLERRTAANPTTLAIDIGGTGIKMVRMNSRGEPLSQRARELTPQPPLPHAVIAAIKKMLATQGEYDRVSVGFPGVVVHGIVHSAPNLGTAHWQNFDLRKTIERTTGKPARVVNDADLQGYGVILGVGVELVFTLGTGLGSALYSNGHLVPNLELAHHLFGKNMTYEQRVSNSELKKIGRKKWNKRVRQIIEQLEPILNFDVLHIGGGNARKLIGDLPPKVRIFENIDGLAGGVRLWKDDVR